MTKERKYVSCNGLERYIFMYLKKALILQEAAIMIGLENGVER